MDANVVKDMAMGREETGKGMTAKLTANKHQERTTPR